MFPPTHGAGTGRGGFLSQSGTGKEHGAGRDHKASTHLGGVWMVCFCESCREQRFFFGEERYYFDERGCRWWLG